MCVCVCVWPLSSGKGEGARKDGLGVDAEEFAVVVELLEPRVERGRFDGVGLLFEFGNHVEKDGGVALGLCVFRVPGTTKGVIGVSQHESCSGHSGRRRGAACAQLSRLGRD